MKQLKYIFTAAIALVVAAGCQEEMEDTFPTDPIAPVLVNNGTILMTQNTMDESVTWSWSAARFVADAPTYSLYVQYAEETPKQVGASTQELFITMPKTGLRTLLEGFTTIPANSTFDVNFYVTANDGANTYTSTKQLVKVYAYGDAVSAEVTAEQTEVVLDITNPTGELTLLSWTDARLTYGEPVTYNVTIAYNGGEPKEVASGLTTNSVTKTVDEWNELAVAAGAPETEAAPLQFTVTAVSESYPEGVPAAPVTITMTTYLATYPAQLYLPGSYQGWTVDNTATLKVLYHSTLTKGLFEGFVDLTTSEGTDVEFKFNPELGWNNVDFGIAADAEVTTDGDGNVVVKAAVGGANKNVKVPSGIYRISLNKKLNTLEMLKVESIGIIGDATPDGWDAETPMFYDAATNTYSVTTTMVSGKEYKFRMNNNWTFSIGNDGTFSGGNFTFDKADGEYKLVLDVNKHPYTVKILSTAYPERLYLPGS
ncbi:MAG: SusE domain-containing protein, partial [Prevotellaceae bacterium]|nr:SusE domain-containing protein [Prevotellaceae bacterium]